MTATLGWLHISDLHFLEKQAWRDNKPLQMLIEDLKALLKDGLRVDLVLCTGDIGFGETKVESLASQYADATAFFDKVLETCQLKRERLFLVPGNHDIDRSKVRKSQTEWLRSEKRNTDQINQDFRDNDGEIKQAMERLAGYRKFIAENYPHIPLDDKATFGAKVEINGISIAISGLNSAWTCVDNDDRNQIWLAGEAQLYANGKVIEATAGDTPPNLRLCLLHHPQNWLQPSEAQRLRGRLEQDFDFVLHGHAHDQWVDEKTTPQHVIIAAGATTGESVQEFGYNLVQIGLGKAEVHLRCYDTKGCGWTEENIHGRTKQGVWPLSPLGNLPALTNTSAPPSILAASGGSPLNRGYFGLETVLEDCSSRLAKNRLLAVFGMAGVGKTILVEELHLRPEWRSHRLTQITARQDSGITDFFGQIAPLLGIHDERPRPPSGKTTAEFAEALRQMTPNVPPFFLHIQRAHLWLQNGHWKDANLAKLLESLPMAYPESVVVWETREQPVVGVFSFEVTGLPKRVLPEYLAAPPGLTTGWVLPGDQRAYIFSRLGGGHGRGAHAYGMTLLVRLAAEKSTSPYDILKQYPDLYARTLYDKLFRDLYENVLTEGERALLFACSLYRDGLHYGHLPRLEQLTLAQDAGASLIRRRLLTENADWLYLHDLAAEQARKLSPDEKRTLELHRFIASLWLDELQGQKALMEANIRRALEALYHLEQGGQGERVAEIAPVLFGRRPEETVQALWRMEENFIARHQHNKVLIVLEYLLKVSPNDHRAMRFLGECRRKLFGSKDNEALELFRQATHIDPGFPSYWANYGHAAIASDDEETREEFLKGVAGTSERVQNDPHVVAVWANALEAVGRDDNAALMRQDMIAKDSPHSAFYADHAKWLLDKKGDVAGALTLLEQSRKKNCSSDITEAIYASALEAAGRGGEAAILRQEKIDDGNRNAAFYADHAIWLLDNEHNADAALNVLKRARELGCANEVTEDIYARILEAAGRKVEG